MAPRGADPPSQDMVKTAISVTPDLYQWIMDRVGGGKPFSSFSHGVRRCIEICRGLEEEYALTPDMLTGDSVPPKPGQKKRPK